MDSGRQSELKELYEMKDLPTSLDWPAVDDLPDGLTQSKVIKNLVPDPEVPDLYNYKYAVCRKWHQHWVEYYFYQCTSTPPGPLTMGTKHDHLYTEGHIWKQLLKWYGCVPGYLFIRSTKVGGTLSFATFKVGYLNELAESPLHLKRLPWYSSMFKHCITMATDLWRGKHQRIVLNTSESIGYVEFQARCFLNVPKDVKTRLWYQQKGYGGGKVEPLFDRCQTLSDFIKIQKGATYMLMLERKDSDGFWPSGVPETLNDIDLENYYMLTEQLNLTDITGKDSDSESTESLKDSNDGDLLDVLSETAVTHKVRDCQRLKHQAKHCIFQYDEQLKYLKEEIRQLNDNQAELLSMMATLAAEKYQFNEMKDKFDADQRLVKEQNKFAESLVKLSVGGHNYHTSIATLTSDPDSMLAKMFSGKFPLEMLDDGSYFIDRDGSRFPYVLNCLRNGEFDEGSLPDDADTCKAIFQEMDFYQIKGFKHVAEKCQAQQEVFGFTDSYFTELLQDDVSAE